MQIPDFDLYTPGAEPGWQKTRSEALFFNPHVGVEKAHFTTPSRGTEVPWMVVKRKAAVAIAPVLEDGRFVMVHQERLPVMQTMWEFPAGQIDTAVTRESVIHTIQNELREECGCALHPDLGTLQPLGWYFPSQGFTDEIVYLFTAKPVCVVSRPEPDGSEHISDVRFVSAGELRGMIAANAITNALTLALYARIAAKGLL
ncbi:NUDIX hydrolase [Prosthecobacter fluviatilis]|uniref:GDP-mannose pyrophosphatase n=1 Tax=Prosthecobacter fluviatilis TaxID=445931 RepID=A0ABW0KJ00_9BACT